MKNKPILIVLIMLSAAAASFAQTTEFTYQGLLKDGANAATGNYDFEFALFDLSGGGTQQGATLTRSTVAVTNGTFAVKLDFGSQFPGADRFLEIRVRLSAGGAFTPLIPRQQVNSAPYSVKTLNADNAANATNATNATTAATATDALSLGGVAAGQYVLTGDARLSDARNPLPNSPNYIQNQNAATQATSNFNISGNGTVGGNLTANGNGVGIAVLGNGGTGTGVNGTTTTGTGVFGISSTGKGVYGFSSSGGNGVQGESSNSGGTGVFGTSSTGNGVYGFSSGTGTGVRGVSSSGLAGDFTGPVNISGNGTAGGTLSGNIVNSTTQYNIGGSHVLSVAGNGNLFAGVGAGAANTGVDNSFVGASAGLSNMGGSFNSFFGRTAGQANTTGSNNTIIGNGANVGANNLTFATAIGSGAIVSTNNTIALGRQFGFDTVYVQGFLRINNLGAASTNTNLCFGNTSLVSFCTSSIRYKSNVLSLKSGLDIVGRLRPVTFDWKETSQKDLGLIAEEVEAIDPLLVTYNKEGVIQGVKYDQLTVVLINAVNEQQTQIEALQQQIKGQRAEIEAFKALVCAQNSTAEACRPKN